MKLSIKQMFAVLMGAERPGHLNSAENKERLSGMTFAERNGVTGTLSERRNPLLARFNILQGKHPNGLSIMTSEDGSVKKSSLASRVARAIAYKS